MNKIWKFLVGRGSAISYAIITAIFTIFPEDIFKSVKICKVWSDTRSVFINRLIVCLVVFALSNVIYALYRKFRKKVSVRGKNYSIQFEYANLLEIRSGKIVINFDECFTTKVGNSPGDIKAGSICGQYLNTHRELNIQELIEKEKVKPTKGKSKYKGKDKYTPGTIVPNGDDLLMAFAKLDENGRGNMTYDEYLVCLDTLWEQIDIYHGTDDVYVPILGSRITYFDKDFTQQELLDIMIHSYSLSPKKLREPNKLHIVCKERDDFSINKAFGVE